MSRRAGAGQHPRGFVRRNRFQVLVSGAMVAILGLAGIAEASSGDAVSARSTEKTTFPTADFEDPVFAAAADALAAAAAAAGSQGVLTPDETPAEAPDAPPGSSDDTVATTPAPSPGTEPGSANGGNNSSGNDGGSDELPPLGAEAIDFSVRLTPTEVGADGVFRADLVAVNTGDRTAKATVSSVDFTISGSDGVLYSGSYRIGFPMTVGAGEEKAIGITVDPSMISWIIDDVPEVIKAGTYSGAVTINVRGAAPVTHDVSITYTEDIDLVAWATERCQATIDGWNDGGFLLGETVPDVVSTEGVVVSTEGVEVTVGSDEYPPPTLEECLTWYGF